MGILTRYRDIMASKLDSSNNLDRRVKQYLDNLYQDLGKIKSETATIIVEEQRAKRILNECRSDIGKMERYAKRAAEAGESEKAGNYLEKQNSLVEKETELEEAVNLAISNSVKIKEMHQKIVSDIAELEDMLHSNELEDISDVKKQN